MSYFISCLWSSCYFSIRIMSSCYASHITLTFRVGGMFLISASLTIFYTWHVVGVSVATGRTTGVQSPAVPHWFSPQRTWTPWRPTHPPVRSCRKLFPGGGWKRHGSLGDHSRLVEKSGVVELYLHPLHTSSWNEARGHLSCFVTCKCAGCLPSFKFHISGRAILLVMSEWRPRKVYAYNFVIFHFTVAITATEAAIVFSCQIGSQGPIWKMVR